MTVATKATLITQEAVALFKGINRRYERLSKEEKDLVNIVVSLSPEEMKIYLELTKGREEPTRFSRQRIKAKLQEEEE